jgi:hypothetical protein
MLFSSIGVIAIPILIPERKTKNYEYNIESNATYSRKGLVSRKQSIIEKSSTHK